MAHKIKRSATYTVRESTNATIRGMDADIEFDRTFTCDHDAHYGADADGNRGVPMDFIEDEDQTDIQVTFQDENEPQPLGTLPAAEQAEVLAAIADYLTRSRGRAVSSRGAPTPPEEPDGPDPDERYDAWVDRQIEDAPCR